MSYLSPTLTLLVNAVKKATSFLDREFSEIEQLQSSVRGAQTFAEKSYNKLSQNLRVELGKIKPGCAIFEDKMPIEQGPCFLIAPVDGLGNFVRGIRNFATTVAYCESGEVKAAVICSPAGDELFFAEKGNGAYKEGFRNHERLRVSAVKDAPAALVGVNVGAEKGSAEYVTAWNKMLAASDNIRCCGSVALELANVAAGKTDVCGAFKSNLSGLVAGLLLVREAGGYLYNLDKKPLEPQKVEQVMASDNIVAANANIKDLVAKIA